jgi:hypothetical protein
VNRCARIVFVSLSILVLFLDQIVNAEPFEDFFDALKHAFTQPVHHQPHRTTHKTKSEAASESKTSSSDSNGVQAPPNERNTRTATRAAGGKDANSALRYGAPVPGKKGFVTSPFAPDGGYIDVRGFPPGTAVKDPYSGKVFLTP